jgi:hypothetical protein
MPFFNRRVISSRFSIDPDIAGSLRRFEQAARIRSGWLRSDPG